VNGEESTAARASPAPRATKRWLFAASALIVLIAIGGYVVASHAPSYDAPKDDEIRVLLELAGVFPDAYDIVWREHGMLRSTDAIALRDPELLRGALFTHDLTTGAAPSEGDVYVEAAYSFFDHDRRLDLPATLAGREVHLDVSNFAAKEGAYGCWCETRGEAPPATECSAALSYGNYDFSFTVDYNKDRCVAAEAAPQRREEFLRAVKVADQLFHMYLEPLRRKPKWL
jgi:hypothetical protein